MSVVTAVPWLIYKVIRAVGSRDTREHPALLLELLQLLMSLSSILVPLIYLFTVPTYFTQVFADQERYSIFYKLGFGRKLCVDQHSKRQQFRPDIFEAGITPIEEEEGEGGDVTESEEYIELPAITVQPSPPEGTVISNGRHEQSDSIL